jgi:hypothetical protein
MWMKTVTSLSPTILVIGGRNEHVDERSETLAEHLTATAQRPVERTASRWLGEAEAVATDVAESDLDPETRRERLEKIEHLLSNVEGTGDSQADEHVDAAREIVMSLLESGP